MRTGGRTCPHFRARMEAVLKVALDLLAVGEG